MESIHGTWKLKITDASEYYISRAKLKRGATLTYLLVQMYYIISILASTRHVDNIDFKPVISKIKSLSVVVADKPLDSVEIIMY
jgi:hypothetical protein